MSVNIDPNGPAAEIAAGMMIGTPKQAVDGGGWFAVVPDECTLVDLNEYLPRPAYLRSTTHLRTLTGFTDYMKRHGTPDSAIFADAEKGLFSGVVDFHGADNAPTHRSHAAYYKAPFSEEWLAWSKIDGDKMKQETFAAFIEEHSVDIVTPAGATMLEVARAFEARSKSVFRSALRLDNGNIDFAYAEDTTAIAGKMTVPTEIEIGLPIFYRGPAYRVRCFFRYRIDNGRLVVWIDIHRKKQLIDDAFAEMIAQVRTALPEQHLYETA